VRVPLSTMATRNDFHSVVVGDTNADIQNTITDLVDWIIERNDREWRNIAQYIQARVRRIARRTAASSRSC